MEEGIFPHYNAINDGSNSAIEEERRLCYVAITRAKKELYITSAETRMLFGNTNRNMPSRFIEEIDKKLSSKLNRYIDLVEIMSRENDYLLDKIGMIMEAVYE